MDVNKELFQRAVASRTTFHQYIGTLFPPPAEWKLTDQLSIGGRRGKKMKRRGAGLRHSKGTIYVLLHQ